MLLAGLPATGKSTLAARLSERLNERALPTVVLNKDDVRAALFPGTATEYSRPQDDLCIRAMLMAAAYQRGCVSPPAFILFDGRTFSRRSQLEQVIAEAGQHWRILHLVVSDAIARQRLERTAATHLAADRTFSLYLALQKSFEPLTCPHLSIDTGMPLTACVEKALEYLTGSSAA